MKNAVMVTGGAGYVGSHIVRRLLEDGRPVVVVDNLSTGHPEVISLFSNVYGPDQFCFEKADLLCEECVKRVFRNHEIIGIIDFAAKILVPESQEKPRLYFDNNVLAFLNLINLSRNIPIVKSSTAATYGEPEEKDIPLVETYQKVCISNNVFPESQLMPAKVDFKTLLDWYKDGVVTKRKDFELSSEDEALLKISTNVYGITKMMDEIILAKSSEFDNRQYISLRYFNAAGADESRLMGEDHNPETHLIPIVLQVALGKRSQLTVYGDDYNTRDGTTVRDYVSVQDLTEAHVLCLEYLLKGGKSQTFNLGTGNGFSVKEILESARKVTGKEIPAVIGERRSGDPATLVADTTSIHNMLGWKAKKSLEEIIMSAWNWHRLNPEGYRVTQEERFNPFWNRWVNIAAHRRNRPWFGQTEGMDEATKDKYKPDCHLCPGNRRAKGDINPLYTGVWTFKNDFPTLGMDTYKICTEDGPYKARTSIGVCEVVNYSPDHSLRMSIMEMDEITNVIDEWANIYKRLGEIQEIKYPLIFENRGKIMGNSQLHPHGQVYAYGELPDLIVKPQIEMFQTYREKTGRCFVCDANEAEIRDGRRILVDLPKILAYVPYAAQLPYDVMIIPKHHLASLLDMDKETRKELAQALKVVLTGLDKLFDMPYHYSLALIQTPTDGTDYGFHLQVHITSLLSGPGIRKHIVGADIFGRIINQSDPNETAEEIRYRIRKNL